MDTTQTNCGCAPTWKKVLSFLLDFFGSFIIFGVLVAYFSGNLTKEGFHLEGTPALVNFVLMIVYFVAMRKIFGRTLGKMLFRIKARKNSCS